MVAQVPRVLLVATSATHLGDTEIGTGAWIEELTTPYYYFQRKGYIVDMASIRGGNIPWDELSLSNIKKSHTVKMYMFDKQAQAAFSSTPSIVYIDPIQYDAIFLGGGHGMAWDAPYNAELRRVLDEMIATNKVVAAVEHGVAALVQIEVLDTETQKIQPFVAGKQVTSITNKEEEAMHRANLVPFLLETKLKQLGAIFVKGTVAGRPFAVRSDKLITGQNAASAQAVAELVVEALSLGVRLTP